jgi:hypothetical protein
MNWLLATKFLIKKIGLPFSTSNPSLLQRTLPRLDLGAFFDSGKGWAWSESEITTGRAWTATELRQKGFEDLHFLWWSCLKERNKLESQKQEGRRFKIYFVHGQRVVQVKETFVTRGE